MVSTQYVRIYVDCQEVAEKPIKEPGNITTDGYEVLGKLTKGDKKSAPVTFFNFSSWKVNSLTNHF